MSNRLEKNPENNNQEFRFPESSHEKPNAELEVNEAKQYQRNPEGDLSEARRVIEALVINKDGSIEVPEGLKELGVISEKKVIANGQEYLIRYVTKEFIGIGFGEAHARTGVADVREDLPERVRRFVESHELYHLTDPKFIPGDLMSEVRANFYPGIKDPVGLALTLIATLRDPDRRAYYKQFLKKKLMDRRG